MPVPATRVGGFQGLVINRHHGLAQRVCAQDQSSTLKGGQRDEPALGLDRVRLTLEPAHLQNAALDGLAQPPQRAFARVPAQCARGQNTGAEAHGKEIARSRQVQIDATRSVLHRGTRQADLNLLGQKNQARWQQRHKAG